MLLRESVVFSEAAICTVGVLAAFQAKLCRACTKMLLDSVLHPRERPVNLQKRVHVHQRGHEQENPIHSVCTAALYTGPSLTVVETPRHKEDYNSQEVKTVQHTVLLECALQCLVAELSARQKDHSGRQRQRTRLRQPEHQHPLCLRLAAHHAPRLGRL